LAVDASPDPAQKAVVDAFIPLVSNHKVIWDEKGDVRKIAVSNHQMFKKDGQETPGLDDNIFARILELKQIEAVALETQDLSNAGFALLGQLKNLRDVRLHYVGKNVKKSPAPDKDAPLFINELPLPLEVLEIKHCFQIKGGCMEKLKPQPELRKLEIDNGYADGSAVGFIKNAPKIENLQIHRTKMNDADLQEIFKALPELEILLIRPDGQKGEGRITGKSLRGLKNCPKLRYAVLGIQWGEMPFEGGLDVFVGLTKMEKIAFNVNDIKGFSINDPEIQKLHKARPDIEIRIGQDKIGGVEGRVTEQEDADWKWDEGVTTHG
jgi:hypothetical protein